MKMTGNFDYDREMVETVLAATKEAALYMERVNEEVFDKLNDFRSSLAEDFCETYVFFDSSRFDRFF